MHELLTRVNYRKAPCLMSSHRWLRRALAPGNGHEKRRDALEHLAAILFKVPTLRLRSQTLLPAESAEAMQRLWSRMPAKKSCAAFRRP